MTNDNPYLTHSTKVVYQNAWITVREDQITHPSGEINDNQTLTALYLAELKLKEEK